MNKQSPLTEQQKRGLLADLSRLSPKEQISFFILLPFIITIIGATGFVGPNLYEIGRFLNLGSIKNIEIELGSVLNSVTFVFQAIGGITFGYLTDRFKRKNLMMLILILVGGSNIIIALMGIYFADAPNILSLDKYYLFLLFRCSSLFGTGAVYGIMISYVGDFFSTKERTVAIGYMIITHDIGMGLGMIVTGLSANDPGWHFPFLIYGIANIIILLIVFILAVEVRRGVGESELMEHILENNQEYKARIKLSDIKKILKVRTNWLILAQNFFGNAPWGAIFIFSIEFFKEKFFISTSTATLMIMFFLAGSPLGSLVAGYVNRKYLEKNPRFLFMISALGLILMTIIISIVYHMPVEQGGGTEYIVLVIAMGICGSFFNGFSNATQKSVSLNVNVPENRGIITAMGGVFALSGLSIGTLLVGYLKNYFTNEVYAFDVSWSAWVICAITWVGFIFTVPGDQKAFRERLKQYFSTATTGE